VLGSEDLSRYEAMLVRFTAPLTVNGNGYLGDRGELVLSNGRRETPTNRYPAGLAGSAPAGGRQPANTS
jgi:predicted extracellular nuclease